MCSQQCFSDSATLRPADLLSSFTTIKTVMNNLYDGLAEILRSLLKNTSTRENVLQYIAEVINKNASRAHIQVTSYFRIAMSRTSRLICCEVRKQTSHFTFLVIVSCASYSMLFLNMDCKSFYSVLILPYWWFI